MVSKTTLAPFAALGQGSAASAGASVPLRARDGSRRRSAAGGGTAGQGDAVGPTTHATYAAAGRTWSGTVASIFTAALMGWFGLALAWGLLR